MTSFRANRRWMRQIATIPVILALGCAPSPSPPDSVDVAITSATKVSAARGSGPAVLADATWAAFRKADPNDGAAADAPSTSPYGGVLDGRNILQRPEPDTVMLRIRFGANGRAELLSDNDFYAPQIFGPEFIIDGQVHTSATPLLVYATNSYGVSDGNRFGFAAPIEVWLGGLPVGEGLAYAWGVVDGDRLDGTFGYQVKITLPGTPFGEGGADQYPFYALRKKPE